MNGVAAARDHRHGREAAVSVIVPYYNGSSTIQRVLASIDAQTVRPREIVIVDDGSQCPLSLHDLSCEVSLRLIRHPINRGIAAARNTGIRSAREDWVAFIDHDDEWTPDKLERQWRLIQHVSEPQRVAFYGRCIWVEPAEHKAEIFPGPESAKALREGGQDAIIHLLRRGLGVPFITFLAHRDLFRHHGYLDERIRGGSDDYEFILRLARRGVVFATSDFDRANTYSAVYHMGEQNHSRGLWFLRDDLIFLNKLADESPSLSSHVRTAIARSHYRAGRIHERRNDLTAAREEYRTSLRYDRFNIRARLAVLTLPLSGGGGRRILALGWRYARALRGAVVEFLYRHQIRGQTSR